VDPLFSSDLVSVFANISEHNVINNLKNNLIVLFYMSDIYKYPSVNFKLKFKGVNQTFVMSFFLKK